MVNKPLAKISGGGILWYDRRGLGWPASILPLVKPSGSKPIFPILGGDDDLLQLQLWSQQMLLSLWVISVHKGHLYKTNPKVHALFFSVEGTQKIHHIFENACLIPSKMGHLMTLVSSLVAPWWNLDPLLYIYGYIYIYHISSWVSLISYL